MTTHAPAEDTTRDALEAPQAVPFVEISGYLFGFFVSEPPSEPPHVHVKGKGGKAKLWLATGTAGRKQLYQGRDP